MAAILRQDGYAVVTAEDGDQAILQILFGPKVDAVVMGMLLPPAESVKPEYQDFVI